MSNAILTTQIADASLTDEIITSYVYNFMESRTDHLTDDAKEREIKAILVSVFTELRKGDTKLFNRKNEVIAMLQSVIDTLSA